MKRILGIVLALVMVLTMGAFAEENSQYVIGFSSKDNSDTFVANIADAAVAKAEELGVKLLMYDARGDVNQQISDVETMIAQGVDAIVVIPQSVEGSAPVVQMCNDAGIPIIIDNGDIADKNYTMVDLAKQGIAIIMISSEMPELIGMSNRIMVMAGGKVKGEFEDTENVTQQEIMDLAFGGK